jgi:Flp pilus assembly protein TadG
VLRDERGAAATELVLVTPVLLALLFLVVLAGRLALTNSDVTGAARDAARAASLERNAGAAQVAAQQSAEANLERQGTHCDQLSVDTNVDNFRNGGSVRVEVTCDVALGDLALLAIPGTKPVSGHATEVIDVYRSVTP